MLRIFEARNLPEAHFVSGLLGAAGIPNEIRGDTLWPTLGAGADIPGLLPTVWLRRPEDRGRALAVIGNHRLAAPEAGAGCPWTCPNCQEPLEAPFTACWRCGTERPPVP
jgi:hypothetical protein